MPAAFVLLSPASKQLKTKVEMAVVEFAAEFQSEFTHSGVAEGIGKILPVILAEETHLAASVNGLETTIEPALPSPDCEKEFADRRW